MTKLELIRKGDVYILTMKDGENRFNRSFIDDINAALDEVEHSSGPAALVTVGEGKFYSTGLDLDWMADNGISEGDSFLKDVDKLYIRIMTLPMATAAAINGHAFGAGAIAALAHDYRVMRNDRGYFCLPEIDLRLQFTPVMNALLMSRLFGSSLRDTTLTGARLGGVEAMRLGIVDNAVEESEVLDRTIAYVSALTNKDRITMGAIKRMQNKSVLDILNIS